MENQGIGELINYIFGSIFLLSSITYFVSAWMCEKKSLKIRRIILGYIFLILFILIVFDIIKKYNN